MDMIAEHNHRMKVFHDIVGCAFDVYNEYKPGLTEYPYQYGLKYLLKKLGYQVEKEYNLPLYLFGERLPEYYRCDLVLIHDEGNIIIECKAVKCIADEHRDQLKNYLLLTHCPYGMLINFCKTTFQVYSETYEYLQTHSVERLDTKYIGVCHEPTIKPWQPYLDQHTKRR